MPWYVPARFRIARFLGPSYCLRCVVFHDISDTESLFTKGLQVTVTRKTFEAALTFIVRHYTPVSLQQVISMSDVRDLPPRPVLMTFDDAYTSVRDFAAPLCSTFGVPAVFFVNGACLDNKQLALHNLICYVSNVCGLATINAAIRSVDCGGSPEVTSLDAIFSELLPTLSPATTNIFRRALVKLAGISEDALAAEADLYLSSKQLRDFAAFNFEIGNHTYSHVNCRSLSPADFAEEIDQNKRVLESAAGSQVRSFSIPFGSSVDLTSELSIHLHFSGYEAVFLGEGCANSSRPGQLEFDRVSVTGNYDSTLFSEIEILPRLRSIRNSLFGTANRSTATECRTAFTTRPSTESGAISPQVREQGVPGVNTRNKGFFKVTSNDTQ
jgi:peptidoglycan/xylan/chitin deacetylase (PgdA/CDA1 family)